MLTAAGWAFAIWFVWYGWFLFATPTSFRKRIYGNKYLVLCVDIIVTMLGGAGMSAASGSMTAGIGTAMLAVMCFITSLCLIGWYKLMDKIQPHALFGRRV